MYTQSLFWQTQRAGLVLSLREAAMINPSQFDLDYFIWPTRFPGLVVTVKNVKKGAFMLIHFYTYMQYML